MDLVWVRERVAKERGAQRKLADHVGVSPSVMNKILWEKRPMREKEAAKIRDYYGLSAPGQGVRMPPPLQDDPRSTAAIVVDEDVPKLPVYRTTTAEGRMGGWVVDGTRIVDESPRNQRQLLAIRAFQVEVMDDRNDEVFQLHDFLTIDPDQEGHPQENCLFVGDLWQAGGAPAMVGKMISHDAKEWVIRQHNVQGNIKLPKSEFPYAWRVTDRTLRR
jgi:hypothetical protein